jgi:hypothetical protein
MAISRFWTAKDVWREASRDVTGNVGDYAPLNIERFTIINRIVAEVAGLFFALMKNEYITPQVVVVDNAGDYNTGSGTYTFATRTLAATMHTGWVASDVGKFITFRSGDDIYSGYIYQVLTAGSVVMAAGMNMPTGNLATVENILMIHSVPDTDEIDISTMNIFKSGGSQVNIAIWSTSTRDVYAVDLEELLDFRSTAEKNATKIVYHVANDKIRLRKGVATYGTLLVYYPRIPIPVTVDADYIDLPDGAPTAMAIMLVKRVIAQRMGLKGFYNPADMQALVYDVYKQFDMEVALEDVKDKVKALS